MPKHPSPFYKKKKDNTVNNSDNFSEYRNERTFKAHIFEGIDKQQKRKKINAQERKNYYQQLLTVGFDILQRNDPEVAERSAEQIIHNQLPVLEKPHNELAAAINKNKEDIAHVNSESSTKALYTIVGIPIVTMAVIKAINFVAPESWHGPVTSAVGIVGIASAFSYGVYSIITQHEKKDKLTKERDAILATPDPYPDFVQAVEVIRDNKIDMMKKKKIRKNIEHVVTVLANTL